MLNEFWRRLCDTVGCNSYIATFGDPSREIVGIESYTYTVDYFNTAVPVTQTSGLNTNVIMDSDSDFVLTYLSTAAVVTGQTNIIFNAALNIQILDKSSGKTWFSAPAPCPLLAGYMGFPFILSSPRVIKPRTTLNLSYSSIQPGTTFDGFFFAFGGAKIYYK